MHYTTGNSFNSETVRETVGCAWADLDTAKMALSYIREHYYMIQLYESYSSFDNNRSTPKFVKSNYECRPWFREEYWQYGMILPVDLHQNRPIDAFWYGHFETLHGMRIVSEEDTDMGFTI